MGLPIASMVGRAWVATACLAPLAGCGGGVFFSIGGGGSAPSVSLAASVRDAAPGDPVRLVAAAAGERSIAQVIFFRLDDGSGTVQLGSDASAPFEWVAVVPADARTRVRFVARAFDDIGRSGDSDVVTVNVR
jgi:hypothetical protein